MVRQPSSLYKLLKTYHEMIIELEIFLNQIWLYCNLKTMSDVFYGWRLQTLIQLCGWTVGGVVFQGCRKSCFFICFCFWFVLLFCRLLRRDIGELVLVMEHNLDSLTKTIYELCESGLCEGIWEDISGERRDESGEIYMMLAEDNKGEFFFGEKMKLSC